ncbi:MAG TPA: TVP38/TMEM64 family protein [Stellaceae bacterium]|nr:TVP38/TMEM64 family protein [Stellaceae bacterium]
MAETSPHRCSFCRLIPLGVLLLAAGVFVLCGGRSYLTFATLAHNQDFLRGLVIDGGILAVLGYVLLYAGLTALSIPSAMLMTLAGGFFFGPWLGATYALTGATLGATAVFLAARVGLYGLAACAGPRVQRLEAGFREDAFSYLLCLRLVPVVPFWLVNLIAGLMGMRVLSYIAATFLGMVPGALVYASLGNGVGALIANGQHPDRYMIFRPYILLPIIGLAVLALVPVVYKRWRGGRRHEPAQ